MRKGYLLIVGLLVGIALAGCAGEEWPEGLRKTPSGTGPMVVWNLDARPFPDVPFPNNIATRLDPTSPTGRRVNVSMIAPTKLETRVRQKINKLSGFGIYSPISVSFSAPLDIGSIVERHQNNDDIKDDAVLLINLNKGSAEYGRAAAIDMGRGNFPLTLERRDNYFENDPNFSASTIVYPDTNTYPPGADPDKNMLTFYERETNTLIIRPIVPLEEEALYAVVLTNRLIGEDGEPVRSPFPYINHLSQTESLRPIIDILPKYGLTIDDVAFVWNFTTQGTTRDFVAIRKGLYGKGPLSWLSGKFPNLLDSVMPLHTFTDSSQYILKIEKLLSIVDPLVNELAGELPSEDVKAIIDGYSSVDYVIAGTYTTPYFLVDRDGMATEGFPDDENEVFDLDPMSGEAVVGKGKVLFWCTIPKTTSWGKPPFPVVFYSHGYTTFKIEMIGFAGSLARFGLATCGIDAVGHGVCLDKALGLFIRGFLKGAGVEPVFDVISPARARDLDNDGECESGGDFWTADTFHTRDVVRQTIVDHIQLIRILRGFDGKTRWQFDLNGDGVLELAGDFNADGTPDIGGPVADYYHMGSSLGGILSSILPGVEPAITAAASVAGGAGLADIGIRSVQGGVVEAVFLRIMGPLMVGSPRITGETELKFLYPDVNELGVRTFATVQGISEGDRIILRNIRSGEVDEAVATRDSCYDPANEVNPGWRGDMGPCFRISFAADALRAGEKRVKLGITLRETQEPDFAREGKPIENPREFGDPIVIEVRDGAAGKLKQTIDMFGQDVVIQGGRFKKGTQLVAPSEGFGMWRSTPDIRKFMNVAEVILEPGDPVSFAPRYHLKPLDFLDIDPELEMGANVLVIPTVGDMNVPVNTGIATARAAGIIPIFQKEPIKHSVKVSDTTLMEFPAYTHSQNQILLDTYVIEGLERLNRWTDSKGGLLLDIDNLSIGTDFTSGAGSRQVPRLEPPLRATVNTKTGVAGMRIPYMKPTGQHGFDIPHPRDDFDICAYMINLIGRYFQSRGKQILDDPCLEIYTVPVCPSIPLVPKQP